MYRDSKTLPCFDYKIELQTRTGVVTCLDSGMGCAPEVDGGHTIPVLRRLGQRGREP